MLWDYLKEFKRNYMTTQLYTFIYQEHQRRLACDKELDGVDFKDDEEINPPKKPRTADELKAAPNDQSSSKSSSEATIPETPHQIKNEVPENLQSLESHDPMEVTASITKCEQQPTCSSATSRHEMDILSPKPQKTKITDFFKKL